MLFVCFGLRWGVCLYVRGHRRMPCMTQSLQLTTTASILCEKYSYSCLKNKKHTLKTRAMEDVVTSMEDKAQIKKNKVEKEGEMPPVAPEFHLDNGCGDILMLKRNT